ncbi:MAG: Tim44/TimA family putative adaptor protein [Alphaproteobacteria bacterium]|nr:Tim44/TimA family putative adaptor protein [Alphaproteobacteria bacterium]
MSEGIPYADIVIIALIAGFILLRLRHVLGQKTGHDNPQFFQKKETPPEERRDTVVRPQDKLLKAPKIKEETDPYLNAVVSPSIVQSLNDIKAKEPQFSVTQFVEGAKMAFEMVFDAFAKGDRDTLKMLLADSVYGDFNRELEARERQENKTETTLVAVLSREITDAMLAGNMARITVKFVSEQIVLVRNPQGEIIEGDASDTEHVESEWVFERDVMSKNPNWKIIET